MSRVGVGGHIINLEERINQGFNLFTAPETDISFSNAYDVEYRSVMSLQNDGPFEFNIYTSANEFIIASQTRLTGVVSIRNDANEDITEDDDVAGVNLMFDSLFSSIAIEIDGRQVENSSQCYPYKAYFEKLLSAGRDAKRSHMAGDMYILDDHNSADRMGGNSGYEKRRAQCREGMMEFSIPICSDLFNSTRFLPNNTTYTVRMTRTRDNFCLMSGGEETDYKIHFYDLAMSVRKVVPSESVLREIEKQFNSKPQIFPFTRSLIKNFVLPSGLLDGSLFNIFTGTQLPRSIIVGMVSQTAYSGSYKKNPYYFQHYNCCEMSVRVNNISYPTIPYRPNFPEDRFQKMYRGLFDNIGIYSSDVGLDITPLHFKGNCFINVFDLTPDRCNGFHRHRNLQGVMDLNLKFRTPLGEAVKVIIYGVYENIIIKDKNLGVELDF